MPKISVIIPIYNVEKYLDECIKSILKQTLNDIEIICVNDESTDKSMSILDKYKDDKRFKIINMKHSGAACCRNAALNIATGEYVCFIDSDDSYPDDNVLHDLYNIAIDTNLPLVAGSMEGNFNGKIYRLNEFSFTKDEIIDYKNYQIDYGFTRFLYKLSFLKNNNILFPEFSYHEDPPFLVKALICSGKFYATKRIVYTYRQLHKKVNFSLTMVEDLLESIELLLSLSHNSYFKLYYRVVSRLNEEYLYKQIQKFISNEHILNKLKNILKCLNFKIIFEVDPDFQLVDFYKKYLNNCKISVVIPVYNVEKYLEKCLNSVVNQTYKNIEILCVYDKSNDKSFEILSMYTQKFNNIKIISENTQNLSSARNAGIKYATGLYCYFLDSDDYIDLNTLTILSEKMIRNNADVVIHEIENVPEDDTVISLATKTQEWIESYSKSEGLYKVPLNIKKDLASVAWNKLYKMSIIKKYNCQFCDGLTVEDEAWLWTYMIHCHNYYFVNQKLYHYFRRSGSMVETKYLTGKCLDLLQIHCEIYKIVSSSSNVNKYKKYLTEQYIQDVSDLMLNLNEEYKQKAISLIKYYIVNYNNHPKVKLLYLKLTHPKIFNRLKNVLGSFFNVENSYIHKVVTILGIKFKFKSKKLLRLHGVNRNSFIEDIFSIKTSQDRKRRIFTFLGIKVKCKRKENLQYVVKKQFEQIIELENEIINMQVELNFNNSNLVKFSKAYDYLVNDFCKYNFQKKIFVIGTAIHDNIGDVAISYAEIKFVQNFFKDYFIIETNTYEFDDKLEYLKSIINKDDIIFLQGGGNLGNRYINEEKIRRKTILSFPENKIIIFPQSIWFSDDENGKNEVIISNNIYSAHKNLTLFCRDPYSLKLAKDYFPSTSSYLTKDIVCSLKYDFRLDRDGVYVCIRDVDDESGLSEEAYNSCINLINNYCNINNISISSGVNRYGQDVPIDIREKVFLDELKKFARAKVVVTDRLHGVIFSIITNTPCVVLKSKDHKIPEFLKHLEDCTLISYLEKDVTKVAEKLDYYLNNSPDLTYPDWDKDFKLMAEIIKGEDKNASM